MMERSAFSAAFCVLFSALLMSEINFADCRKLSRRKRYVAFPEGSTLSIALCMTAQAITRPSELFTEGLNWGLSYDLPNNTATIKEFLYPRYVMQRRHRRDLYQKLEVIMDSMGYDGRTCVFRALCEAGSMFSANGNNVVEEILRIIFGRKSCPLSRRSIACISRRIGLERSEESRSAPRDFLDVRSHYWIWLWAIIARAVYPLLCNPNLPLLR